MYIETWEERISRKSVCTKNTKPLICPICGHKVSAERIYHVQKAGQDYYCCSWLAVKCCQRPKRRKEQIKDDRLTVKEKAGEQEYAFYE